ncbi:MAG TPA: methyltransferase domain-containing protein [Planctomycetota bacterium]|nr:methyltransferase domain-containing protein [Planctomycetota bacterium]
MGQIVELIRLFGLTRLVRMKRRHDRALPIVRGYCTTVSLWALFNTGVMDALAGGAAASAADLARTAGLDARILGYVLDYLDGVRVLKCDAAGRYSLTGLGEVLVREPRGVFDLACGYEPVLNELTGLLKGEKRFGRDVTRRTAAVGRGEAELGRQLPFVVLADEVKRGGFRTVLDLRCGHLEFLFTLCRVDPDVRGFGIDASPEAVEHARERLAASPFRDRVTVEHADFFDIDGLLEHRPDVDVMTAYDTFHEHLLEGTGKVETFLAHCHGKHPGVAMVVAEFCRQPHDRLRRRPTAFAEHHLWHNLTDQVLLSADEWRTVFQRAGYRIEHERVFDIVGHGYFTLR